MPSDKYTNQRISLEYLEKLKKLMVATKARNRTHALESAIDVALEVAEFNSRSPRSPWGKIDNDTLLNVQTIINSKLPLTSMKSKEGKK